MAKLSLNILNRSAKAYLGSILETEVDGKGSTEDEVVRNFDKISNEIRQKLRFKKFQSQKR